MTLEIISYAKSGLLINIKYGKTNKSYSHYSSATSDLDVVAINAKYQNRFEGEIEYSVLGSYNNTSSPTPTPTNTTTPTTTPTLTPTLTPTPTPSLPPLITTNSANFNNCAGNIIMYFADFITCKRI